MVFIKEKFLNYSIHTIKQNNNFDDIKIAELRYGLETFYMLVTKMSVIILISIVLGLSKELCLFLLFYTPLRGFGFGFHANNSLECWLISIPLFIIIPYMIRTVLISKMVINIIIGLTSISFLLFAPADTKKKPLINKKKKLLNKTIVFTLSLVYLIILQFINNPLMINSIMFACLWQSICINPLTYKLFKQSYNNYKTYLKEV